MVKRTITILHIMQGIFPHGGTPRKLLDLLVHGDHDHFRHAFLLFDNSAENLNREYINASAIVQEVKRPRNWDIRLIFDIVKMCKRYKCDIINTHFARADIFGTIVGNFMRIPVIQSAHGITWNDSYWVQKMDKMLSRLRVCTICNSEATRQAVISRNGAKNTQVIYNGVPNHAIFFNPVQRMLKRDELYIPSDGFVVIHVGGLIDWRDQTVIIKAVKKCADVGMNIYLVFVGDGPLRKNLEAESQELGLARRILFLGYRSDVRELNAMSDVFVNMAREEGFGIAVVEAMQAGLPVVLANAGALPELIEDGKSGLLVPAGDINALADVLIMLEQQPEIARRIGDAGRSHAENKFSIQRYVKEMEKLYMAAIEEYHVN